MPKKVLLPRPVVVAFLAAAVACQAAELAKEIPVSAFQPAAAGAETPGRWTPEAITPVTAKRIAALPEGEQTAWRAYLAESQRRAAAGASHQQAGASPSHAVPPASMSATYSKGARLGAPAAFYGSADARDAADHVVAWQRPSGGWTKGGDYTRNPAPGEHTEAPWGAGTFDNDSTTTELRFLALVIAAADADARAATWRAAFQRGIDYVLASQYPNGGFPQIYPLGGSYHDAVTFNDDAMVHILELLRAVSQQKGAFSFVPADTAKRAADAVDRGIACVLATQLRTPSGRLLIWAQQYDAITLQPSVARNFEPVAACTSESAGLVQFLMSLDKPSPAIVNAVEGAMSWFTATALKNAIWDRKASTGTGLVAQPGAPELWARYYDVETGRPVFGDRDRTVHFAVTEISDERREGYSWFNTRAASLKKPYAAWRSRLSLP